MKQVFFLLFFYTTLNAAAQAPITRYYNSEWRDTSADKAAFYAVFKKSGDMYACTTYTINTTRVRGISTFTDTSFTKPVGWQLFYYPNGRLQDSTFYDNNSTAKDSWHYYPNKILAVHFSVPDGATTPVVEGYDETGKRDKKYILFQEAAFKGGDAAWMKYLSKQLSKEIYNTKDKTELTVNATVEFLVDESGYVIRPKLLESSGNRTVDAEVIRVIASSPQWQPAIQYNKPVKAYRKQPFTYTLLPMPKAK